MDFAELRSSIFEGEEDATLEETPFRDQLRRPLVGFPLILGAGALCLWAFDKFFGVSGVTKIFSSKYFVDLIPFLSNLRT